MATTPLRNPDHLDDVTTHFYRDVLDRLDAAQIPALVGGGFALRTYTGISRDTKDLDVFIFPGDVQRVIKLFTDAGYKTDLTYPHWLGKIHQGDRVVDIIFSSGNGLCRVDGAWFVHAREDTVLDRPVWVAPPEEVIWQKAFIMERHRYDGADVIHLLRSQGSKLDWDRLLSRFGEHWPVLLSHLLLARFVYPEEESDAARSAIRTLLRKLTEQMDQGYWTSLHSPVVCRGTFLSLLEYLPAVEQWGYRDARLPPTGYMSAEMIDHWTTNFER